MVPAGVEEKDLPFKVVIDEGMAKNNVVPMRRRDVGNVLGTKVHEGEKFEVYFPEKPRVPHHLCLALKRQVSRIADVNAEENHELYTILRKISEVYATIGVEGFVIAQYDHPQLGHQNRFVVEVIPHLPGFEKVKHIIDKMDCNRYVLFREANVSPIEYEVLHQEEFWKGAFNDWYFPLSEKEVTHRQECFEEEANAILYQHLWEVLEDQGAKVSGLKPEFRAHMPTKLPDEIKTHAFSKCFFCQPEIIQKQLVYEYQNILVFYNIRKGAREGANFLILPRRHVQKVYGLTREEEENIRLVRGALVEVLKEKHPGWEVVIYVQDDPTIGQTVLHSHHQVVVVHPKVTPLAWTLMSLQRQLVSPEEMERVKQEYGRRLEAKLQGQPEEKQTA